MRYYPLAILLFFIHICNYSVAQTPLQTDIKLPKNTVEGKLKNGLHYIILPNSSPNNVVEMRLVMNLGSSLENDNQRGVAHYLEHVAFIGTKNFPKRSMVEYWERAGMKFGKDINAFTGYDRTIYMVSLPVNDKKDKIIDTSLLALKDWLCNISFEKERTDREKGIILEELSGYKIEDEFYKLKIGVNEYSKHFPLSNTDDISNVNYKKLTTFYKKWYAPQLATVVVVGDIDAGEVEKKINTIFSNVKKKNIKGFQKFPLEYNDGVEMMEIKDSLKRKSVVELIIPHNCIVGNNVEDTYKKEFGNIITSILNNRFSVRGIECTTTDSWYLANTNHFVFSFVQKEKKDLLKQIERTSAEINSILQNGFENGEVKAAINRVTKWFEVDTFLTSGLLCENFIDYIISGDKYIQDTTEMDLLKSLLKSTKSEVLRNKLEEILYNINETLLIAFKNYLPKNESLTEKEILDAWNNGKKIDVEPYEYVEKKYIHQTFPTPDCLLTERPIPEDIITSKKTYKNLKLTEVKLKNGVTILFKPTKNGSDVTLFTTFSRGGIGDLSKNDFHKYEGTAGYMEMGGIEKVPYDELASFLSDNNISLNISISNYWHGLMGMFPQKKAKEFFNLVYEKINYPELCYTDFADIKDDEIKNYKNDNLLLQLLKRDPNRLIVNRLDSLVGNAPSASFSAKTLNDLKALNLDSIATYYKRLFSNTNNLNILITGDYNIKDIEKYVIATFGSMQNNGEIYKSSIKNQLPKKTHIEEFEEMNSNQTTLEYVYAGHYTPSLKNGLILKLMRDILQNRVISILREENNLVYSPYISLFYNGLPQQTFYFNISTAVKYENTEKAHKIINEIINNLKNNPIQNTELESLKKSFINTKNQTLTNDASSMWRDIILGLIKNGEDLQHFDMYNEYLNSITPKDIQNGFNSFINQNNYILLHSGKISKEIF